ncbi:hypothetical protein Dthio_PD2200 [Desulfonatronospira thiodismutans ASO3-1]|uniref:Uncharacterized protein n=1 Tax=Desulfonatronospira thiodismutans ASO3-1 TaxID=555779 RepID=D6SPZ0_9BACT|nr:YrzE family protein [Desulfonatronospira thiodismutans]EFI34816.1 hypothetical protein Dthio_PD2200 [Desulfonatronospira thiodismutans ASO3-1]
MNKIKIDDLKDILQIIEGARNQTLERIRIAERAKYKKIRKVISDFPFKVLNLDDDFVKKIEVNDIDLEKRIEETKRWEIKESRREKIDKFIKSEKKEVEELNRIEEEVKRLEKSGFNKFEELDPGSRKKIGDMVKEDAERLENAKIAARMFEQERKTRKKEELTKILFKLICYAILFLIVFIPLISFFIFFGDTLKDLFGVFLGIFVLGGIIGCAWMFGVTALLLWLVGMTPWKYFVYDAIEWDRLL